MRNEWMGIVRRELVAAVDEMGRVIGAKVRFEIDEGADVIIPRFIAPSRLEDYLTSDDRRRARALGMKTARETASVAITRIWAAARKVNPRLWSYTAWYDDRLKEQGGTADLSVDDFAAHMKMRRHGQTPD